MSIVVSEPSVQSTSSKSPFHLDAEVWAGLKCQYHLRSRRKLHLDTVRPVYLGVAPRLWFLQILDANLHPFDFEAQIDAEGRLRRPRSIRKPQECHLHPWFGGFSIIRELSSPPQEVVKEVSDLCSKGVIWGLWPFETDNFPAEPNYMGSRQQFVQSSSTFKDPERASLRDSGHGDSDQADSDQDTNKGSCCDMSVREALKMKTTSTKSQPLEQGTGRNPKAEEWGGQISGSKKL
ncbi:UNVERIFIED_CONTAM: hypothetical protein K2H54_013532 [Gekko kuhli]